MRSPGERIRSTRPPAWLVNNRRERRRLWRGQRMKIQHTRTAGAAALDGQLKISRPSAIRSSAECASFLPAEPHTCAIRAYTSRTVCFTTNNARVLPALREKFSSALPPRICSREIAAAGLCTRRLAERVRSLLGRPLIPQGHCDGDRVPQARTLAIETEPP